MKVILVTGGAGFIGSNFIKYFLRRNKNYIIVNMDKLTYSGSMENLEDVEDSPRHHFIKGDICNHEFVSYILKRYRPDYIVNFAAETSYERSLTHPLQFMQTNTAGTLVLLDGAKYIWNKNDLSGKRFIQVSTDEVYGFNRDSGEFFSEDSALLPVNPYSASKASADFAVNAYVSTFGFPAIIARVCNCYGPYQHSGNFIPQCVTKLLNDSPIPYEMLHKGVREWLHVQDCCISIIRALFYGKPGEIYNIGSGEELSYLDVAQKIALMFNKPDLFDCPAEARNENNSRCAMNSYKSKINLNWSSKYTFTEGLKETIQWYKGNRQYWDS